MTPTDALHYRRRLLEECDQMTQTQDTVLGPDATVNDLVSFLRPNLNDDDDVTLAVAMTTAYRLIRQVLPLAQVYYVSADMTAVARAASRSMPDQPFRLDDVPTPNGFVIYDAPISWDTDADGRFEVRGAVWSVSDGALYIWPFTVEPGPKGVIPLIQTHCHPGDIPGVDAGPSRHMVKPLLTTWALMSQSLTIHSPEQADRPERRRAAKLNLPTEVVVLRLRRLSTTTDADTADTAATWSHRWLVGGHWRNQYLPSRRAHRLQWISPYIKGPEGLPLIVKEHITAWIR